MEDFLMWVFILIAVAIGLAFYFLPTIVAVKRQKANRVMISAVNFLFGWAFVGWVLALAWALNGPRGDARLQVER